MHKSLTYNIFTHNLNFTSVSFV